MDASTLSDAVKGWLEGARTHEHALSLVRRAEALGPTMDDLRRRSTLLQSRAAYLLAQLPKQAAVEEKRAAWELQDEGTTLSRALGRETQQYRDLLSAALTHSPGLAEARELLAAVEEGADELGRGSLSLASTPSGARVHLHRVHTDDRRLVPAEPIDLGLTPLDGVEIEAGSWLVRVGHEEGSLAYPIHVKPGEHWDGVAPGTHGPHPVPLSSPRSSEAVIITGSWFRCGGELAGANTLPAQKVWVPDFAIHIHPVTTAEYLAFLNAIPDASTHTPQSLRLPGWRRSKGAWALPSEVDPRQPVTGITAASAQAYADWLAAQEALPWRLPTEHEWEKAARGSDLRRHPWGNHVEPTWCCHLDSHAAAPTLAPVDDFPVDVSPYGVRGLGGNVSDWCTSVIEGEDALVARGGHWLAPADHTHCALRFRVPFGADDTVGFRLVRTLT